MTQFFSAAPAQASEANDPPPSTERAELFQQGTCICVGMCGDFWLVLNIYSRHPEWLPSTGPSSLDRLRPQNYKGSVRVCGVDVPQIVRGAVKEAVALLSCHPWFANSAEKFAAWEKEGITTPANEQGALC